MTDYYSLGEPPQIRTLDDIDGLLAATGDNYLTCHETAAILRVLAQEIRALKDAQTTRQATP